MAVHSYSPEELAQCEAFRDADAPRPRDATVIVDLDEAGAIYLADKQSGPRPVPVLEVCTATVSPPDGSGEVDKGYNVNNSNAADSTSDAVDGKAEQEPHNGVVQPLNPAPVIDNNGLTQRIKATMLWKQRLEYLLAREDKKHAAGCAALRLNRIGHYNSAYSHVKSIVKHLEERLSQLVKSTPVALTEGVAGLFASGRPE